MMSDASTLDVHRVEERKAASVEGDPLNIQRVITSLRRRLWLFSGVSLGVAALVAGATLTHPPGFTADATLLIANRAPDAANLNSINPQEATPVFPTASSGVDTEVEVLKSRALAANVVDKLELQNSPNFNTALRPPSPIPNIKQLILGGGAPMSPEMKAAVEREATIDQVISKLLVKRVGTSFALDVAFTAPDPNEAAAIANAFVQLYLTRGLQQKVALSHTATGWLETRLDQLRQQVQAADASVQQYKIANDLLSASGATLTEQEITNIDTQVAAARAQDAEQDARYTTARRQLAQGSNGGDVGEALNNPVVAALRSQRAQASAHLADLQARYGPKHPEILKAERSLADIDAQIDAEIKRVISNLAAQSEIAHSRTGALTATAAGARARLAGNNQALVKLDELQRNADAARSIYEALLSRYKEALVKEGTQLPDATVASAAQPPIHPSLPNKRLDLFLAIVLGLFCGSAAVIVSELLKRGVSSATDVQQAFDLPFLGEIPSVRSTLPRSARRGRRPDPARYVVEKPLSRFTESFRNLRAALLASKVGEPVKVIAVTSSLPGEGKTTTAICLARTSALSGQRVVLVDCDLRKRSVNKLLRTEPEVGLVEVLNGSVTLAEALRADKESGVAILPLAKSGFTPRDILGSQEMSALLDRFRAEYDMVILDTPPALAVADARVVCPKADVVLFVTAWRRTSKKAVASALQALEGGGSFLAGVALTKVNVREQARSGEGSTHYYRAYDSYYVG